MYQVVVLVSPYNLLFIGLQYAYSPSDMLNAHNTQMGSAEAYDTNDLLKRHTNPHLWKFSDDVEDLIAHSNGLKVSFALVLILY